ncbi:hypothetical protein METUNv1_01716 [Methyloversatilis universalis FAM5]|uniref:Uncharacterized protein n=1 Tax=Methyloversatilis universalis (strain ATCC BAA-1314 / DSM 25237 / JCM 13912 / CCUG 52030 / FAM5) TaxID=1000565 RepID=F5RBS1_METUF|nr:hypothetical protein [Methyloversatilis universalis]EGK71938.1 hypothetical protein METUNv1_01716 [Methyloversatilis universalis FAM5]
MAGKWQNRWSMAAPFRFSKVGVGDARHVVFDAEGRVICSQVREDVGVLFASAPTMYATLAQLGETFEEGDPRRELVRRALARADGEQV